MKLLLVGLAVFLAVTAIGNLFTVGHDYGRPAVTCQTEYGHGPGQKDHYERICQ